LSSPIKEEVKPVGLKNYSSGTNPAKIVITDRVSSVQTNQYNTPLLNTKPLAVPQADDLNLVAVSPSKAEIRKVNNFSKARDYTSNDA
jgi:hypothetical protein